MDRAELARVPGALRLPGPGDPVRQAGNGPVRPPPHRQLPSMDERVEDLVTVLDTAGAHWAVLYGGNYGAQLAMVFATALATDVRPVLPAIQCPTRRAPPRGRRAHRASGTAGTWPNTSQGRGWWSSTEPTCSSPPRRRPRRHRGVPHGAAAPDAVGSSPAGRDVHRPRRPDRPRRAHRGPGLAGHAGPTRHARRPGPRTSPRAQGQHHRRRHRRHLRRSQPGGAVRGGDLDGRHGRRRDKQRVSDSVLGRRTALDS